MAIHDHDGYIYAIIREIQHRLLTTQTAPIVCLADQKCACSCTDRCSSFRQRSLRSYYRLRHLNTKNSRSYLTKTTQHSPAHLCHQEHHARLRRPREQNKKRGNHFDRSVCHGRHPWLTPTFRHHARSSKADLRKALTRPPLGLMSRWHLHWVCCCRARWRSDPGIEPMKPLDGSQSYLCSQSL
jgi:hypothetical protein